MNAQAAEICPRQKLLALVIATVEEEINNSRYKVEPTSVLIDDLGFDSIDVMELAMTLEEKLGFEIPETTIDKFTTPNSITDGLLKLNRKIAL